MVRNCRRLGFIAAVMLMIGTGAGHASDLSDFNAAVADAYRHYREALFYLDTGNAGVAAFELESAAAKWRALRERYAGDPPDAFADDPRWRQTLEWVGRQLDAALMAAEAGDAEGAEAKLAPIRSALSDLRRRNGVVVFSDCVNELDATMDELWTYRHQPPDLGSREAVNAVKAKIGVVTYLLERCRSRAPRSYKENEEFRRLTEDALHSVASLWGAVDDQDRQRFVNILRELRPYVHILFLRFG